MLRIVLRSCTWQGGLWDYRSTRKPPPPKSAVAEGQAGEADTSSAVGGSDYGDEVRSVPEKRRSEVADTASRSKRGRGGDVGAGDGDGHNGWEPARGPDADSDMYDAGAER